MPSSSTSKKSASYGQILKSTTIVGGAQGVNLLIGLVRTKLVALLLGPSGVGLVGLYQSATGMIGTLTGLGISSSGVRQVAEADGSNDQQRIGKTIRVLRRMCWLSGTLSALICAALSWPLSLWIFSSTTHVWAIGVLGLVLLMESITAGRTALIQGMRRIGDLARLQVFSGITGMVTSVGLYAWLGEAGIVPVLLVSALANLGVAWWFSQRVSVPAVTVTWTETLNEARGLVALGLAFMLSGLLAAGVTFATRTLVVKYFGMDANGLYQAAWGISGVFAGFVLQAMGADFYPRLTAVAHDHEQMNQMVNDQTELGILLALPGLLATLIFAPGIIHLLYSASFVGASELLPWFVLGVFGRVISWPLAFIQLAKGESRWFATTETVFSVVHLLLVILVCSLAGLKGVAMAFAALYAFYTLGMLWTAKHLSGFSWSASTCHLLMWSVLVIGCSFVLTTFVSGPWMIMAGLLIVCFVGIMCLRQLCQQLERSHRLVRLLIGIPGFKRLLML